MLNKATVFLLIGSLLFSCTPSNAEKTMLTAVPTSTVQITVAPPPSPTPASTRIPTEPPQSKECGEFTSIPSKGWGAYPEDYEPVGYLRVFAYSDSLVYGPVIVEMGRFINPGELRINNGIMIFSASFGTETSEFYPHWYVFIDQAPSDLRTKVNTDRIVGSMEIVDLENKELPYSIDPATVDRIVYDVEDYVFRNSLLDLACPCQTEVNGIRFYYSRQH